MPIQGQRTGRKINLWKNPSVDYTSRDFQSIRDDMIRTIPFFTPEWTDFNPSDFGIVMVELLAYMGDVLHFYIDRMAAESFLPTALTRRSVTNLLKLIDYELRSKVASSADLEFSIAEPLNQDLVIPAGTRCKTLCDRRGSQMEIANNIPFETTRDLTIQAGALTGTVSAVQGITKEQEVLGTSDGLANQRFLIPDKSIIHESERIYVDEGVGPVEWEIVDTMIDNYGCDEVCMVQTQATGESYVFFGDNGTGKIPDPGAVIIATYRSGGGSIGNVGHSTITLIDSPVTLNGSPITVAVTNPLPASGGQDEQDIENARIAGPRSLRALNRAVTPEDFQSLSEIIPGVASAKGYTSGWADSNKAACCPVNMFVVPAGGGLPSTQLKRDIVEYFQSIKMACTVVEVFDPLYQPINVKGNVVVYSNFVPEEVFNDVLDHLDAFFDTENSPYTGFDKGVYLSDIMCTVDGVNGVDHVDFSELTRKPYPHYIRWASESFDPETITNEYAHFDDSEWVIGDDSRLEQWTITFVNPTEFSVVGSVTGYRGIGSLGEPFVIANDLGQLILRFLLLAGSIGNYAGDLVRFTTSPKIGNIEMGVGEFFSQGDIEITITVGGAGPRVRCV